MSGRRSALLAMLLAIILTGCLDGEPPSGPPPRAVKVVPARVGPLANRREYVGNLRAVNRVDVRARVRGYLIEQLFEDGARVAEDELLFRIDPRPFEVALAEAKAELARERANAVRAERDLERARELFGGDVVSQAAIDQREADRNAAVAAVAAAVAEVQAAELELSYCRVRAPAAGRISRALIDIGNLVGESGQDTILAELVQEDPIHAYFAPPEGDRSRWGDPGRAAGDAGTSVTRTPARLRLADGTEYPHEGVVDYIAPTVDATRGTFVARALIPNPQGRLRPGQFARVITVFPDLPGAVVIPQRAVLDEQGGSYVWVVLGDDTVQRRPIRLGRMADGLQHVLEGLAGGERVVVDGVQGLRPGDRVRPERVEPPTTG